MTKPETEPPVLLTKEMAERWITFCPVELHPAIRSLVSGATVVVPARDAADARRWRYLRKFDRIEIHFGEIIDLAYIGEKDSGVWNDEAIDASIEAALAATQEEKK